MIGKTLYNGRYTIDEEVSQGGFATIYKAQEKERPRPVAIKVSKVDDDPGYAKSIQSEAKIIQRLGHRNIVNIYPIPRNNRPPVYSARATQISGGPYFFVMEYLSGGTLNDYLEAVGPLPPAEAAAIAVEIARALDHMHLVGYAHNDLKLENIMFRQPVQVGKPYLPVLIDFGIATRIQPPGAITYYITPPEQLKHVKMMIPPELEEDIDRMKVDVWGLGVILYRMLGAKLPFNGRNTKRITDRIINSRPTSLLRYSDLVTPEWDQLIIDGCLAKDPKQRLTMLDLGQKLKVLGAGAVASQEIAEEKPWWKRS